MPEPYMDWRQYQEETASFFRGLGCSVDVEAVVHGPYAEHRVDVWVQFVRYGVQCKWVVECKLWNSNVSKEKVMALKAIVDDVGADRGIIITEKGFQSGAYDAARGKNLTLVTALEEFKRTALTAMESRPLRKSALQPDTADGLYLFPDGDQPQSLLIMEKRVVVGNWGTGRIALVDSETRSVLKMIELDKYEQKQSGDQKRAIRSYPPGSMTVADQKLFVGQVFSEFLLAVDLETSAIVKRLLLPGGGEGSITSSSDGKRVYFASNKVPSVFAIDSATYEFSEIPYPGSGQGSLCILAHPTRELLYIGIQRGGRVKGKSLPGGNSFLAVYDLKAERYVAEAYLAEVVDGVSDWSTPICLTYDASTAELFVGMFQSRRGICRFNTSTNEIINWITPALKADDSSLRWADPLSQALYKDFLLIVNRNNYELAVFERSTGKEVSYYPLGKAPNGPKDVAVTGDTAVICYPARNGLFFIDLTDLPARQ